ncbi:hypothetical protein MNBD_GAMMA16-709 [hydrothermal vent metagenome]|uniref:Uncharacterized protein n=1 Tax=hydrothermal vent metagenome TaxID=652676 RepID=A0A3B0YY50_9ZZZZ
MTACASTPGSPDHRPDWIDQIPNNGAVGSSSYEIFGEARARKDAVMKAISSIAIQKSSTVNVDGTVSKVTSVNSQDGKETFREAAIVTVEANIQGRKIQVSAKIKEYWKDTRRRRIWVLMHEE